MQRSLAPPPRRVPLSLRVANVFNGATLGGWFITGFASLFSWIFLANADVSFITLRGELQTANGRVIRTEPTHASEGKVQVIANHYEFSIGGKPFHGVSYSTGPRLNVGQDVNIEYKPDEPRRSRIEGLRQSVFSPTALLVGLFPLAGLLVVAGGSIAGLRRNRLLAEGFVANGTLKEKRSTNVKVRNRPLWRLVFEFTARDGQRHEVTASTTEPSRLEDEKQEPLLYHPDRPSKAFLLDDAPARPQIDAMGELVGRPAAFLRLILPAMVIAGNIAAALL